MVKNGFILAVHLLQKDFILFLGLKRGWTVPPWRLLLPKSQAMAYRYTLREGKPAVLGTAGTGLWVGQDLINFRLNLEPAKLWNSNYAELSWTSAQNLG